MPYNQSDVSSLSDHFKERGGPAVTKAVADPVTIRSGKVSLAKGIKFKERMHYFTKNLYFQLGDCVKNASGSTTWSEKELEVTQFTHYDENCFDIFNSKWMNTRLPAGSNYDDSVYFEEVEENMTEQTQDSVEEAIWQASVDTTGDSNNIMNEIDGFLTRLKTTSYSGETFGVEESYTGFSNSNAKDIVFDLVRNLPKEISKKKVTLFMSPGDYGKLRENFYNDRQGDNIIESKVNDVSSFTLPVYNQVTVLNTPGLAGADDIVLTIDENLIVGTDLLSELDDIEIGYIAHTQEVYERIKFKIGTEIAFPEYVGIYSYE